MNNIKPKLVPRNMTAFSSSIPVEASGNPASSRLESGVGNCFPGLEVDLRNLERRFFPFLTVDFLVDRPVIKIVGADVARASVPEFGLTPNEISIYQSIADYARVELFWEIDIIRADFGQYGPEIDLRKMPIGDELNPDFPASAWTAIRLLRQGQDIEIVIRAPHQITALLKGKRVGYFDPDGALAEMFEPGELGQSLCSPWTHDFRDCGCFYWASNHPDIAQPPTEKSPPLADWNQPVNWLRSTREQDTLPLPASASESPRAIEMGYFEINERWEALNFVLGGRETNKQQSVDNKPGTPYATKKEFLNALRYAAGVELAVMHEYLAAAYSLVSPSSVTGNQELKDDVSAAFAEIMRIAIGEMRHLRAVNTVLRGVTPAGQFVPALQVASSVPTSTSSVTRRIVPRAATLEALDYFIEVEKAAAYIDNMYNNILATLQVDGTEDQCQAIATIMAEGRDHFQAFQDVREWLARHPESDVLRSKIVADPSVPLQQELDATYYSILELLYAGYSAEILQGSSSINSARTLMVLQSGLQGKAEALAAAGFLVAFNRIDDPRFKPLSV